MALIDLLLEEQEAEKLANEAAKKLYTEMKKDSPNDKEIRRLKYESEEKSLHYRTAQHDLNHELFCRLEYYFGGNNSKEKIVDINYECIQNIARAEAKREVNSHYYKRHF